MTIETIERIQASALKKLRERLLEEMDYKYWSAEEENMLYRAFKWSHKAEEEAKEEYVKSKSNTR